MNKSCLKNLGKSILFLGIVIICFINIFRVLNYKTFGDVWNRFYKSDTKHDVVVIGSSHVGCTVDAGLLWDKYGIAASTLHTGTQKLDTSFYYLKEVVRTHHPKVVAIEMYGATFEGINNDIEDIYWSTLPMKWSINFYSYVDEMTSRMDITDILKRQTLLKVPIMHNRYSELEESDFADTVPFLKGYRGSYECTPFETQNEIGEEYREPLHPDCEEMLIRIMEYAKKEEIQLVFFAAPYMASEKEKMRFNTVKQLSDGYGIPFVDFNQLYNEIELDFSKDFRDHGHLNNYGASKVTDYLGNYLDSNYVLEDRRGQVGYESWDENSLWLDLKVLYHDLTQAQDINEYLQMISEMEDEQTVILALTGNYKAQGDVYLERLMQLGISQEDYERGGVFVFKKGQIVLYLPGKEYKQCIKTKPGEIHLESVCTMDENGYEKDKVQLIVNSKDYRMIENGVNIIVYNEETDKIVDAAGVDIYLGLEMVHAEAKFE